MPDRNSQSDALNDVPLPILWARMVDTDDLRRLLDIARREDLGEHGTTDITSELAISPKRTAEAALRARRAGVLAGIPVVAHVVEAFGVRIVVETMHADGATIGSDSTIGRLSGTLRELLAIERTVLNLLGHMSGVATATRHMVDAVRGTRAVICDTRKTLPGLRALEKYAVRCGGGTMHRLGLHDAVLLKDNHLAGLDPDGVAHLVAHVAARARPAAGFVEVEVDGLDQLEAILGLPAGMVDIVLLDNMLGHDGDPTRLRQAVAMRDARGARPLLEASGGISLDRVRAVAETGVDRIAVGALTHSVTALDIGLDIVSVDGVAVAPPGGAQAGAKGGAEAPRQ